MEQNKAKKVDSPEQLNEYIRLSTPGVWILVLAIVVLLANYTNGIFFDCVSGDSFVIEHETDMGMADDAAFIDYYDFHRIEKE